MCYLPRPVIKPVSPALAGIFLTTRPPGKSKKLIIFEKEYLMRNRETLFINVAFTVIMEGYSRGEIFDILQKK